MHGLCFREASRFGTVSIEGTKDSPTEVPCDVTQAGDRFFLNTEPMVKIPEVNARLQSQVITSRRLISEGTAPQWYRIL